MQKLLLLLFVLTLPVVVEAQSAAQSKSRTAQRFESLGLINLQELDSTIVVQLLYATADNFTGKVLYDDLKEAYLQPEVARAVNKANKYLQEKHRGYRLIIYDATRPMIAQQKMWDTVKGTSKYIYVSNPARGGGLHNYGAAVDVSILNAQGIPLSMGTEVDHLGVEAHITHEEELVKKGIITQEERKNRLLLREVMRKAGFRALNSEWWHFNFCSRNEAKQRYKVIE